MPRIENTLFCDGCGAEILYAPVVSSDQTYCCEDCRDGLECRCGEWMEMDDESAGYLTRIGESASNLIYGV